MLPGRTKTITELAAKIGVPLPGLVPVGIDGGLVGVVTLDLVLAWTGQPVGWLRQFARLLTVGTVAANISAGWPDPISVGLHSAAPIMLLVMVEAGRSVLLRRVGFAAGTARDRIPLGRWLLAPVRTWLLWRRMILWQITSFTQALEAELDLRAANAQLRVRYGRRWKRKAPADLVWMLRTGTSSAEACARVQSLVENDSAVPPTLKLTSRLAVMGRMAHSSRKRCGSTSSIGRESVGRCQRRRCGSTSGLVQRGRGFSLGRCEKRIGVAVDTGSAVLEPSHAPAGPNGFHLPNEVQSN